jgi:hypothetical protein
VSFVDRYADELVRAAIEHRRAQVRRARLVSAAAVLLVVVGVVAFVAARSAEEVAAVQVTRPEAGLVQVEFDFTEPPEVVRAALESAGLMVVMETRAAPPDRVGALVGMFAPEGTSEFVSATRRRITVAEGATFVLAVGVDEPGQATSTPVDVTAQGGAYRCVLWPQQDARVLTTVLAGVAPDAYQIFDSVAGRSITPTEIVAGRIIVLAQTFNSPVLRLWIGEGTAVPAPEGCR